MPTELTLAQHLDGLRAALGEFLDAAERAGVEAEVPTCPGWTVRDLIAHQGMVHRWAAALLRGEQVDESAFEEEGRRSAHPLEWLHAGACEVIETVERAAEDTRAPVFLADAPPPRRFWARRQCHETTIHAADALSAALGRCPRSTDTWIRPDLAADGIDELLGGFVARPSSRLRTEEPSTLVVAPTDVSDWWLVELGAKPPVTTRYAEPVDAPRHGDARLSGPAAALYLALWNRAGWNGDELGARDESGLLARWRDQVRVRWA